MPTINETFYVKVNAGAIFPENAPGYLAVLGEMKHLEGPNRYTYHLLGEYTSSSFSEFMSVATQIAAKLKVSEFFFPNDPQMKQRIYAWRLDNQDFERKYKTQRLTYGYAVSSRSNNTEISAILDTIRATLSHSRKRLFFNSRTRLLGLIDSIIPNSSPTYHDHPGPAALGYALASMMFFQGSREDIGHDVRYDDAENFDRPQYSTGRFFKYRIQ